MTVAPSDLIDLVRWASEITFLLDGEGTILYAGGSLLRLLGHPPDGLAGQVFEDVLGPLMDGPVAMFSAAGVPVPFHLKVGKLTGGGQMVVATDQSTAMALAAGPAFDERAGLIVFRLDERGSMVSLNRRWTHLTGQSTSDAMGVGWLRMIHNADRKALRNIAASAHERGEGWTHRFRVHRADSSIAQIEGALAPTADGRSVGVLVPG